MKRSELRLFATRSVAVVAVTALVHLSTSPAAAATPNPIGTISGLTGEVVLLRAEDLEDQSGSRWFDFDSFPWDRPEQWKAHWRAHLKQPIYQGDLILTRGGVVQVRFVDAVEGATEMGVHLVECRLGNSTGVRLSSWQQDSVSDPEGVGEVYRIASIFELRRGEARCRTAPASGYRQSMRWQAGSTSVLIKGTDLTMVYSPESDRLIVTVAEGKVVVAGPGGSSTVDSKKGTVVFVGGVPQQPPSV